MRYPAASRCGRYRTLSRANSSLEPRCTSDYMLCGVEDANAD